MPLCTRPTVASVTESNTFTYVTALSGSSSACAYTNPLSESVNWVFDKYVKYNLPVVFVSTVFLIVSSRTFALTEPSAFVMMRPLKFPILPSIEPTCELMSGKSGSPEPDTRLMVYTSVLS